MEELLEGRRILGMPWPTDWPRIRKDRVSRPVTPLEVNPVTRKVDRGKDTEREKNNLGGCKFYGELR